MIKVAPPALLDAKCDTVTCTSLRTAASPSHRAKFATGNYKKRQMAAGRLTFGGSRRV